MSKRDCERGYSENMGKATLKEDTVGPVVRQRAIRLMFQSPDKHPLKSHLAKNKAYEIKCKLCQSGDANHYSCAHCDKHIFSKMGMIAHLRAHMKPAATCHVCTKPFKSTKHLLQHMITHSNERKFSCNICNRTYKRMSSLDLHKLTHQPKQFQCKHCTKTFTQKIQLQVHGRYHTGEKPYECRYCFKKFTQQTSLNNHILTHTDMKPYPCKFCKKEFRQISNLQQHTLKNHPKKNVDMNRSKKCS